MMGSRKDLLPNFEMPPAPSIQVQECNIEDRVFVCNTVTRKLLSTYAGRSKNKYEKDIKPLSDTDYENLCNQLSSNISLKSVVSEAGNPCPKSLQILMGEISRDSPTCGIFQIAGNSDDINPLRSVLSEIINEDTSPASSTITIIAHYLLRNVHCLLNFCYLGR